MTFRTLRSILLKTSLTTLFCAASLFAQTPSYISFDAPDAGTQTDQGTVPTCINGKGGIAGYYIDSAGTWHGFVRDVTGAVAEFTPAGITGMTVLSINNHGDVVGFGDTSFGTKGFLRTASGNIVHIAVPGALTTWPRAINDSGQITGYYADAHAIHSFIRDSNGVYTPFDDPDSPSDNTSAVAINNNGVVTGYFTDESTGKTHAFIRDQFGNFTNFDAVSGGSWAVGPSTINLSGAIAGSYISFSPMKNRSFVRDSSGVVTDFSVPNTKTTSAVGINDSGFTVGQWTTPVGNVHGFLRSPSGTLRTVDVTFPNLGTFPTGINNAGTITGGYWDTNGVAHGFVR